MTRLPKFILPAALAALICGCGMPGIPQPPSLHLPLPATTFSAAREGANVTLSWTNPTRTTDNVNITFPITASICRIEGPFAAGTHPCTTIGSITANAGAPAQYIDHLPDSLTTGPPRIIGYKLSLQNRRGKSAAAAGPVIAVAGSAPPTPSSLTAQSTARGVILRWQSAAPPYESAESRVYIYRHRVGPPATPPPGALKPIPEPEDQTFDLAATDKAIDTSARADERYTYRVEPYIRVRTTINALPEILDLNGQTSAEVAVDTPDIFPPAVPQSLAAVALKNSLGQSAIDLSWSPSPDPDTAGYIIYRRIADSTTQENSAAPQPISGDKPIPTPAFEDTHVTPGTTYAYTVIAVDTHGNRSAPSAEATETALDPAELPQQ
jgi:hypothetical protein